MKLRHKTLLIVAVTTLALVGALYALTHAILLDGFRQVEEEAAQRQVKQAMAAINEEIGQLSKTAFDWSAWDDAYEFIADGNEEFISSNLVDATLDSTGLRVNLLAFVDGEGAMVFQKHYDFVTDERISPPRGFSDHVSKTGLLKLPEPESSRSGILMLPDTPLLVAARPILTSEVEGPIRGAVIMGRFLNDHELKRLMHITQLSLARQRLDSVLAPDFGAAHRALAADGGVFVQPLSDTSLAGYALLKDLYDRNTLVLRVEMERGVYAQGLITVRYLVTAIAVAGTVFGVVILLLLEGTVLRRLAALGKSVLEVGERRDSASAVSVTGHDELAELANAINGMLGQLSQAEREMVRLERLRALGEMAAGVSHNLNNMLLGILGPAEILQETVEDPDIKRRVDTIVFSAERAAELVRRLNHALPYAREQEVQPVSLSEAVRRAVASAQPRWKDAVEAEGLSIEVSTRVDETASSVRATETGLHDILLNLLFNSIESMPDGGSIAIEVAASGDQVLLSVADTGVGMDPETRRKIFEPFFTTKMTVGTGLGLYTVYNTVNSWGGSIDVESSPGEGSRFTISLPAAEAVAKVAAVVEPAAGRAGHLLVVEDDDAARDSIVQLLSRKHEVTSRNSAEGPAASITSAGFDAAVIDLGMPGVPGDAFARTLRTLDPTLPMILVTGWDLSPSDPRRAPFDFYLQKPFKGHELLSVAAEAIALRDHRRTSGKSDS